MASSSPYSAFSKIVCITLEDQVQRQESTRKLLTSLGIPFEFYYVKRHPRGGRVGCFDSHVRVIRQALQEGHPNILIFEDDVRTTPGYDINVIKEATHFMTPGI